MRPDEMIGQIVGHYRIIRPVGIGGTSTVFLAQDINLQRDVALKVFQAESGETQDFLRRFAREARVVAQLDHPNILPVYDYGEQDHLVYLVMPHMSGGSLRDRIHMQKIFSPQETVEIIGPIIKALQYAHDRGLIHRDIKPANMLFKADGTIMLSDFGLVKVTSPTTETMNQTFSITGQALAGTPDYMSPEQITSQATPTSDIYSMGVILYEMLTGTRPFTADNYMGVLVKQMYEQPRPLCELNPTLSAALERVVLRAMEKDAAKRYQRPEDLRQALLQAITPTTGEASMQVAADSAWPTSISDKATLPSQAVGEQERTASQQQNPATSASAAPLDTQLSTPATPSSGQQPPNQSDPTTYPPARTANLPVPVRRRSTTALIVALIVIILLLVVGFGTTLLLPQLTGGRTTQVSSTPVQTPASTHRPSGTPKGGATAIAATGAAVTTQNVATTTTACPDTGTARVAVLAPLVVGNHQNLVYVVNEGTIDNPTFGTIKRRDANTSLKATEVSKMPNTYISEAQLSQDGQWILFTAKYARQYQLRMLRVDGQGLQTLYCTPANAIIFSSQWSFDQKSVLFDVGSTKPTTYLFDMTSGKVQAEVIPQGQMGYEPRTWLDKTHVYMVGLPPNAGTPPQNLYLLDTQKGANQHDNDLKKISSSSKLCTSFDTSYDSRQLYVSTCNTNAGPETFNGPSSITVQPASGGPAKTIYTSPTLAITTVRAISSTTLLFMVENHTGDTSQNGLWRINTDGTSMTRLSTDTNNAQSLCPFTQYAWSNVSPDGTLYALQSYQPPTNEYSMFYGSLNGGSPNQFADIKDGTQLFLAGWTTM